MNPSFAEAFRTCHRHDICLPFSQALPRSEVYLVFTTRFMDIVDVDIARADLNSRQSNSRNYGRKTSGTVVTCKKSMFHHPKALNTWALQHTCMQEMFVQSTKMKHFQHCISDRHQCPPNRSLVEVLFRKWVVVDMQKNKNLGKIVAQYGQENLTVLYQDYSIKLTWFYWLPPSGSGDTGAGGRGELRHKARAGCSKAAILHSN